MWMALYLCMINPHWKYQTNNKNGKIFNLRMMEEKLNIMIDDMLYIAYRRWKTLYRVK